MKEQIKLLCRTCSWKEAEAKSLGYVDIDYENEHAGFCDECSVNTGHLLTVKILNENL